MNTTQVRIGGAVTYWRLGPSTRGGLSSLAEYLPDVSPIAVLRSALRKPTNPESHVSTHFTIPLVSR